MCQALHIGFDISAVLVAQNLHVEAKFGRKYAIALLQADDKCLKRTSVGERMRDIHET